MSGLDVILAGIAGTRLVEPPAEVAAALIDSPEAGVGLGTLMIAIAILAAGSALGVGAFWLFRRQPNNSGPPLESAPAPAAMAMPAAPVANAVPVAAPTPATAPPVPGSSLVARRLRAAFNEWVEAFDDQPEPWTSFDQLLRENLCEQLQAARVRCYHVRPGADALQTIAQAGGSASTKGPSLREGLLGHVATTGREFAATDSTQGPLVHDLAHRGEESWSWVWPVRSHGATIGIVAVGPVPAAAELKAAVREAVGPLLTLFWLHVVALEQLRIVRRTDHATGVLTRSDFFTLAERALADSYQASEPVVVAVLTLEGLRRLDDSGRWQERDALVERAGQLLARRVRTDDLVGRFSDDRFVLLLRRLDSSLGRLITEKLLTAAQACIGEIAGVADQIRLRAGLVGSGFEQPPLQDLLVAAFEAVERARAADEPVACDLRRAEEGAARNDPVDAAEAAS